MSELGVFAPTDAMTAAEAAGFARRLEAWGYRTIWLPESAGRNVLVHAAWLLANTSTLQVATGIANIYARDPTAMAAAQAALAEQSGGRFLLGLGVSHAPMVEGIRGHDYDRKPVARMRDYLAGMAQAPYRAPAPADRPPTVLAALGPRMLALAAQAADGAFPFNVTPAHTAQARAALGGKRLYVHQRLVAATDPAAARGIARGALAHYFSLENYTNNWRRLGFDEADIAGGGSDRLIDALVGWGEESRLRARIAEQVAAGADQVVVDASQAGTRHPDEALLAALAPGGR